MRTCREKLFKSTNGPGAVLLSASEAACAGIPIRSSCGPLSVAIAGRTPSPAPRLGFDRRAWPIDFCAEACRRLAESGASQRQARPWASWGRARPCSPIDEGSPPRPYRRGLFSRKDCCGIHERAHERAGLISTVPGRARSGRRPPVPSHRHNVWARLWSFSDDARLARCCRSHRASGSRRLLRRLEGIGDFARAGDDRSPSGTSQRADSHRSSTIVQ